VCACRGFEAGFNSRPLLVVIFFAEERNIEVAFSFADFEVLAAAAVPLGRVFTELEAENFVLEATMLIC
jgi:hypothetical protein